MSGPRWELSTMAVSYGGVTDVVSDVSSVSTSMLLLAHEAA